MNHFCSIKKTVVCKTIFAPNYCLVWLKCNVRSSAVLQICSQNFQLIFKTTIPVVYSFTNPSILLANCLNLN